MKKKAQAWGFDLLIASMIFIGGIFVFYIYSLNFPNETEDIINTLTNEGNIVANALLSDGFPSDWNEGNVITPGIITNNKINQTKLERFYNFSTEDYEKTKSLFNTPYEYYITFSENVTISGNQISSMGKNPLNPKNLIKISRITIYKNKPITINVHIWE